MALQQQQPRLQPPEYSRIGERNGLKLPSIASITTPLQPQQPSLDPLSSAASHKAFPPAGTPADWNASQASYKGSRGLVLQGQSMPSVPQHEPSQLRSPTEAGSMKSVDDGRSASMDDPDDRMAVEALCGLGKVDSAPRPIVRSPSGYETPLKYYPIDIEHTRSAATNNEAEPLLSLLTSSHPWLGGTINGSLSAYSSTKSHSPRFIQAGADFVERNIGSPVASTVGTVGRKTGVEGSLRKYLDARRPSGHDLDDPDLPGQDLGSKRRRISSNAADDEQMGHSPRRTFTGHASVDTLPVYDENRSPSYDESESLHLHRRAHIPRSWSTQLMISTSGLGAALNEASLRSLKFVLGALRNANSHVTNLMDALRRLLEDYDSGSIRLEEGQNLSEKTDAMHIDRERRPAPGNMAERITQLNAEIWNTLKSIVHTVSRYTGGALPENASVIVRWQLMSVPRRWQRAVSSQPGTGAEGEKEAVNSAQRMLAFAVEGIDMMEQVGGVVDSTISSAERWLDSMGRKSKQAHQLNQAQQQQQQQQQPQQPQQPAPKYQRQPLTTQASSPPLTGAAYSQGQTPRQDVDMPDLRPEPNTANPS